MITIQGLTDRQRHMMDLLWNCSSQQDVDTLIAALPTKRDQQDARSLVTIAVLESIEQELGFDQEVLADAEACIRRAGSC